MSIASRFSHATPTGAVTSRSRDRFAFLFHPRLTIGHDLGLIWPPLRAVPERLYERLTLDFDLPPVPFARTYLPDAPRDPAGWILMVPFVGKHMLSLARRAQAKVETAVDHAAAMGVSIVGLGALTAPVTDGGRRLAHRTDVGITNGNAFTAAMTFEAVRRLVELCDSDEPVVALVGATGSVGSCVTRLMAKHRTAPRMLLVARGAARLRPLAQEVAVTAPSVDVQTATTIDAVRGAHLVVLLTSAADALLRTEHLRPRAIVLDDTQPRNTDPSLAHSRPDVLLVDGGLVSVPGIHLTSSIDLPHGHVYACLAETMLLALDGHRGHFSLGDPTVDQAEHTMHLAQRYRRFGFKLAPLRTFGRRLGVDALATGIRRHVA